MDSRDQTAVIETTGSSGVIYMTYLHGNCIFMLHFPLCSVITEKEEEGDLHINKLHGG